MSILMLQYINPGILQRVVIDVVKKTSSLELIYGRN